MRHSIVIVVSGMLSLLVFLAVQAENLHQNMLLSQEKIKNIQPIISGIGIIKNVDFNNKRITINHDEISAIGWPAMTMQFVFTDETTGIMTLKPNDKVKFYFIQNGNVSQIKNINLAR